MSDYSILAETYKSADLMKIIASMQLLPSNHGKNVRLESLVRIAVAKSNKNDAPVDLYKFQEIINKEYSESEYEDRPVNLFTENVMFFRGNYVVFPGTVESGTNVLNNLLRTIFISSNDLTYPKSFVENTYDGVTLILNLCNRIAESCGLSRNHSEKISGTELKFPSSDKIERLKEAVTFSEDWIREFSNTWQIQEDIIEQFIVDPNNSSLLEGYPSISPLSTKPLVQLGNEYILLQPTSSVDCLISFIWDQAKKHKCYEELQKNYHNLLWDEMQEFANQMQWQITGIELLPLPKNLHCKEAIFQFDLNKLVYVCFLESGFDQSISEESRDQTEEKTMAYGDLIVERQQVVLEHLDSRFNPDENEFFTLYVLSEVGFPQPYALPASTIGQLNLWFRFTEIMHLIQYEEPDPLLLWKFSKAYTEVSTKCELVYLGGMLDVFTCYKTNDYSLWAEDEERPGLLVIPPGYSQHYIGQSILKRDEHLAPFQFEDETVHKFVFNYCSYAPFYMEVGDSLCSPILLEDFIVPIWFINEQKETQAEQLIISQLEMLAFWLHKLKPEIERYFKNIDRPLTVKIILDQRFKKELRPHEVPSVPLEEIIIPVEVLNQQITITIPLELAHWYAMPHNEGERYVILNFLNAIIFSETGLDKLIELKSIIDVIIPIGSAKMASMLGNANNIQLENRYLPAYRSLQQHDLSIIKVNLIRSYGITVDTKDFSSTKKKKELSYRIATKLHEKLIEKLFQYDSEALMTMLLCYNEACVQQKALRALDLPARIACLDSFSEEVVKLLHKEQDRVKTALALRCLIELIVAHDPIKGQRHPSFDEIDQLLSLMHEMISWASLSDGLKLGLYDPEIKLLACGRIEVDYNSINSHLIPLCVARSENEVYQYTTSYIDLFDVPMYKEENSSIEEIEIDQAFKSEWGIGLIRLQDFIIVLSNFARSNQRAVVGMEEEMLFNIFRNANNNWADNEISSALNVLTLLSDWKVGVSPNGYETSDTYPWYYNRALSFIRKPIAKLIRNDKINYYWGYRHLWASFDNLLSILFSGALRVPEGGELDKQIKKIITEKGKRFRNEVHDWLKANSDLEVIPYEIPIKPGKQLNATTDLGDIDVCAIDRKLAIIYSIECKNTIDSRSVHEMKTEIDKYLGRDGNSGKIQKHIDRDIWLKSNSTMLNTIFRSTESYSVKSLIITAEEIPLAYLKKDDLHMPFISFQKLKKEGSTLLNDIF